MKNALLLFTILILSGSCRNSEDHETLKEKTTDKIAETAMKKSIDDLFSTYEMNFNNALAGNTDKVNDIIKASFAEYVIGSNPMGVMCGKNDEAFAKKIEEGFAFYRKIGSKSMSITSKEITNIDELHNMVKVTWHYTALKENQEITIDFDIFYLLRMEKNGPKIFAYIAGDEQKALKEKGLVD